MHQDDWESLLPLYAFALNYLLSASTGCYPACSMFGYEHVLLFEYALYAEVDGKVQSVAECVHAKE